MAALAMLAMVGCGSGGGGATASGGTGAPATAPDGKKLKIGISIPAADHGWTAGAIWWAKEAMAMYPDIEFTLAPAENPEKQIKDIETMKVKGVDGVVILATESAPITPIAKEVRDAGILVVNVDRGFLEPVADLFIEGDNVAFGRKAAEYIVQKLGGQGKIVVFEGLPSTVNDDRVRGALEVFKKNPGITILDQQSGGWNREKSLNVMQTFLVKHPQIDAVWASDDDMALGVEQALKEANRQGVWIIGGGGMKDVIKKIMDKDPMYPATITYSPSMVAYGVHQAVSMLRDGKEKVMRFTPKHVRMDVEVVTPENAKNYYFPDSVY